MSRNSRWTEAVAQRCSVKKKVLRNFAKFTGKPLCQRFFLNKVAGLRPATLVKKRLRHRCFPVNFAIFLRTPFLTEHLWWLLLTGKCKMHKQNLHKHLQKLC